MGSNRLGLLRSQRSQVGYVANSKYRCNNKPDYFTNTFKLLALIKQKYISIYVDFYSLYPAYNYFWLDFTHLTTVLWWWVYEDGTPMWWSPGGSVGSRDLYLAQMTNGLFWWYGDATYRITVATQLCQRELNTNN